MKRVTVSAPGKLMLSGEWSVLEGAPCIVLAVDRRVYATAAESGKTKINLADFDITTGAVVKGTRIVFEKDDEKLVFTKHAIEACLEYLEGLKIKPKNLELTTKSDISKTIVHGKSEKPGFGSSAAAVTAIAGAVLELHGIKVEKEREALFKLGVIAHYRAQAKIGSGFDIAASVFGGTLVYTRFDAKWLQEELLRKGLAGVVAEKWPGLKHENISLPKNFSIAVGFTGRSASTTELVKKINAFKSEKKDEHAKIIFWIKETTEALVDAIKNEEQKEILTLVDENERLLRELGRASGTELEIEEHRKMVQVATDNYAAAKFSGAGGGDCALAVCFDEKTKKAIRKGWEENGIEVIDVNVSAYGVKVVP